MESFAASVDFHEMSVACPQLTLADCACSCAVTGAIGTVALAIPAWNRGCGGIFNPSFHSLVFVSPLRCRYTVPCSPAFAVTGPDQMVFPSRVTVTWYVPGFTKSRWCQIQFQSNSSTWPTK